MIILITAILMLYQLPTPTPDPPPMSIRVWGNVKPAKSIRSVRPELPIPCGRVRMSAVFIAEAWITEKGVVQRVSILKSAFGGESSDVAREADRRAVEALRNSTFAPASRSESRARTAMW